MNYRRAFTLIELLITISIIAVISFVIVANIRGSFDRSADTVRFLKLRTDLERMRTFAAAGALHNDVFPLGGYGVHFSLQDPRQYVLYAVSAPGAMYEAGDELTGGTIVFGEYTNLVALCASTEQVINSKPCDSGDWTTLSSYLEVQFAGPSQTVARFAESINARHVGGVFKNTVTGQENYFLITLNSSYVEVGEK